MAIQTRSNGTRNAATKSNNRHSANAPRTQRTKTAKSPEAQAKEILATLDRIVQQKFKIQPLKRRDERLAKKVYYAAREKFGSDITRQTDKESRAAWKLWNQKVFTLLFGTEKKPVAPEVIALVTSAIYDTIPDATQDMEAAIAALVEENRRSLERRNERNQDEEDDDDLDDEDEDLEDEEDEEEDDEDEEDEEEDDEDEDEDE